MRDPVLNEYELLESSDKILKDYNADSYHYLREAMVSSVPTKMVSYIYDVSAKNDIDAIDAAMSNIEMVSVNNKDIAEFFANIHRGSDLYEDRPITVSLRNINEIEDIRPQYIDMFVDSISTTVNDIMNGRITSKDELKRTQINPLYFTKTKKNSVKTTIPVESSYKDLLTYANTKNSFKVTEEFLMAVVLPFLRSYGEASKKMMIESVKVKSSITRGFGNLNVYMKTYNNAMVSSIPSDKEKLLSFYLYNIGRMYLELTNYVAYMMVRKINNYSQNVSEYIQLYSTIKSFYPEGKAILHESVLDASFADLDEISNVSDLLSGQCSVFNSYAQRIYNSHISDLEQIRSEKSDIGVSVYDTDITDEDYDKSGYNAIEEVLSGIIDTVKSIEVNAKDPYLSVDELQNKIYEGSSLLDRYNSILCGISDISTYTDQLTDGSSFKKETVFMTIMNELREFPNNMNQMTAKISSTYDILSTLRDRLKENINGEFDRFNDVDELIKMIDDFEIQYRDVVLVLCKSIIKRLEALDNTASSIISMTYDQGSVDMNDDTDYAKESVLSCMDANDISLKYILESYTKEYFEKSIEHTYGGTFVATEDSNVEIENNETEGTKPIKADDDGSAKEELTKLLNETHTFMTNSLKGFGNKVKSQKEVNTKWLELNKEACLNRKLRNSKIKIYNYDKAMDKHVVSDIQALTTKINSLTEETINGDKNAIISDLFSFINISAEIPIREKMNQWYISGSAVSKEEEIQNSQIETMIPNMISYCELYYGNLADNIISALDSLRAAWETKLGSFKNPNMENVREVNKQVKYFMGSVINNARDKAFAYMKTLNSILPAGSKKKEETTDTNQNINQNQE